MIDFKNFKIKRGPSKDLHDPRLIVEEGYWYLSTDKAELFIGIVENGAPVLKPINGELIPEVNLEGYATEDFVREAIASIEIPEVELYDDTELRNLVNSKADKEHTHEEYSLIDHKHDEYLTAHQDISHLATKEELPNLDGYAKLENIPDVSKFITEIPSDYITENELENKGYLTEHQSLAGYATESYVLAEIAKAALEGNDIDLSTYATKEFVAEEINKIEVPEAYDDAELRTLINGKAESDHTHEEYSLVDHKHTEYLTEHQDLSHLALKEHEHSEYITEHQSLEHLALKEHKHDEYLTEHQSLEGYAKTADLFSKDYNDLTNKPEIPSIEGLASETYVQTEIGKIKFPETDLSNYYTKEEVDALLPVEELEEVKTKVETVLLPKVEEEIEPTVAELKAWVDANNEIQDVILAKVGEDLNILENNIGYVKVDDRSFAEVIDETFAKKSEIPSLEEYAKLEDVPSVEGLATEDFVKEEINKIEHPANPTKVSELENDANYTNETKVLELIAANTVVADNKIGVDFTTDITVGRLTVGTEIKADMTIGEILRRILMCDHNWIDADCTTPKTCSICGKTEGEALGHDYGDWVITKQPEVGVPGEQQKTCKRCGDVITEEIPALPQPEEPTAKLYYLGGIGNNEQQDFPSTWAELEDAGYSAFNPAIRSSYYLTEMKNNDSREYTDETIVGQHALQWKVTAPLGYDKDLSEMMEYDVIISDTDSMFAAIALPSNYEVTAWSTDADNVYSVIADMNKVETSEDCSIYYLESESGAVKYGNNTPTYYITIAKK